MKTLLIAFFFLTTVAALNAQSVQSCKANPKVVDQCFKIHGRVRVVNGAGTVIWRIGTDRKLWVEDEENVPHNLGEAINKPGDADGRDIFGDFEVCPFTKSKPGEMQMVCVESASHLVVRENTH